jgi:hypothetical protein
MTIERTEFHAFRGELKDDLRALGTKMDELSTQVSGIACAPWNGARTGRTSRSHGAISRSSRWAGRC